MSRHQHQTSAAGQATPHSDQSAKAERMEREAFDYLVRSILLDFRQAATLHEVAFSLSHGLNDLLMSRASKFQLSSAEHAAISDAIDFAWQAADDRMPPWFNRLRLADGMEAAIAIVDRWRRAPSERDRRQLIQSLDVFARAEILKNDFHSIGLEEDIARRAAHREASRRKWREDTIAAMAVLESEHPAATYRRRAA